MPGLAGKKFDWLDGRNLCREYCMDLVSLEEQEKNNLIFRLIQTNDVPYIWTSGRLCDFKGCENRPDLEPKTVNGWFWSSSRQKIEPTNRVPTGWSKWQMTFSTSICLRQSIFEYTNRVFWSYQCSFFLHF